MAITSDRVFGLRTQVSDYSYVDRGRLDDEILRLARRNLHIALKGESKSGKSWLRQKAFPDAAVVQCRIDHDLNKIYTDILRALGISRVKIGELSRREISFSARGAVGVNLLQRAAAAVGIDVKSEKEKSFAEIGGGADDLPFMAEIIRTSGRRVVIEDFHYLGEQVRFSLAQDLKALWDYQVYVVVVGIWSHKNFLTFLNNDLSGRVHEISLYWSEDDLAASLEKGCKVLNCEILDDVSTALVGDSYGNIGILQSLALQYLDECGIQERQRYRTVLNDMDRLTDAGMRYAEQLEAVYSNFAKRVSKGVRQRKNATRIYAHALWTIFDFDDQTLIDGAPFEKVFDTSHAREPRIQKGNLKIVLQKINELQVDEWGKGLIVAYDEGNAVVVVVNRTVLFFRKYRTYPWPWEDMATQEVDTQSEMGFQEDD